MKNKRTLFIIVLIVFNIAIDQISKVIVESNVDRGSETSILGHVFTLHHVKNAGAFLGMGSNFNPILKTILLLILPVAVLTFVIVHLFKDKTMDRKSMIGFCLITGGGIANIYDRILYGEVTDFLHIDLGGPLRTGIFNIADVSVMVGMGFLLMANFKTKKTVKIEDAEEKLL